jgi:hypothetical protein
MYEHSYNNIEPTVCLSMCRRAAGPIGLYFRKINKICDDIGKYTPPRVRCMTDLLIIISRFIKRALHQQMAKQSVNTKHRGGNKNTRSEMQASGGKSARKSDEIAKTPTRGSSAEVTPSMKISKRENRQKPKRSNKAKRRGWPTSSARDHVCQLRRGRAPRSMLSYSKGRTEVPTARRGRASHP